jgi:hypothetical protein
LINRGHPDGLPDRPAAWRHVFLCAAVFANQALVEYTLFSKALLPDDAYEAALKKYISNKRLCIDAMK